MFPPVPDVAFFYMSAGALALSLLACVATVILYVKVRRLTLGKNGADLEAVINELALRTKNLEAFRRELEKYLREVDKALAQSIRGVATVRFNPFQGDGSGGNQSFATALLDEEGNGVVISTLYARDRVSVFGKPVAKGLSSYNLTDEEREALAKARVAPRTR